jgi:hypothetical protein
MLETISLPRNSANKLHDASSVTPIMKEPNICMFRALKFNFVDSFLAGNIKVTLIIITEPSFNINMN